MFLVHNAPQPKFLRHFFLQNHHVGAIRIAGYFKKKQPQKKKHPIGMLVCAGIGNRGWVIDTTFTKSILTFSGNWLDVTTMFFKIT